MIKNYLCFTESISRERKIVSKYTGNHFQRTRFRAGWRSSIHRLGTTTYRNDSKFLNFSSPFSLSFFICSILIKIITSRLTCITLNQRRNRRKVLSWWKEFSISQMNLDGHGAVNSERFNYPQGVGRSLLGSRGCPFYFRGKLSHYANLRRNDCVHVPE